MRTGLRGRMLGASVALALVVASAFAVLLVSTGDLRDSAERARHSEEVIATANRLEKVLLDIQTGHRGFVITGHERFLDPWRSGIESFSSQASLMEQLVGDNPAQLARAQAITQAGRSFIDDYSRPVVTTARRDLERARARVASGEGKRLFDAIRVQFGVFLATEDLLRSERRATARTSADRAVVLGVAALGGSVLLVLLFAGYLGRTVVVPVGRVSAAAGELASGNLSARALEGGVGEVAELGRAFNSMAASLEEGREELESQNVELQLQASELEQQRQEIHTMNEELESRNRELERARAAAEESDQLVRSIVRGATDLAFVAVDLEGVIVMFSEGAERMLGYRADELVGRATPVAFHDGEEIEARADELGIAPGFEVFVHSARQGVAETRDWAYVRRDGRRLTVSLTVTPRRGAGGELVGFTGIAVDVTELRRAEEEIRVLSDAIEEQRLELDRFFSLSLELLCIAGLDGFFKRLNPAFEQVLGYAPDELLAEPFIDFVHPNDRDVTLAEVAKLARGEDTIAFENRYRCKDGSYRWLLWSARAMPDRGLIYAAARDVTDRREADERIATLNQELESQNLELELSAAELETRQVDLEEANFELEAQQGELERALDELGAEKTRVEALYQFVDRLASEIELEPFARRALAEIGELVGAEVGTLYVLDENRGTYQLAAARGVDPAKLPGDVALGVGLAGQALAEQRRVAISHGESGLRLRVLGEEIAVHHELHVPLVAAGRALGVLTLARVSDRPFSEGERTMIDHLADQVAVVLAHRLALEQARYVASINRAVLDATVDGIRLVDVEGRTLLANEEIERITSDVFGLPVESTLAERSEAIRDRLVDPESFLAAQAAIAADPNAETLDEFQVAESKRWFRRYTAPVRNAAGELVGRIVVLRETTSERESERVKSELVATVSHELRTPLTGIMGFAELLAKHDVDDVTSRSYVRTIYDEARRLTALVNDFLDLQRMESAEFGLTTETFELGGLLAHEVDLYSMQDNGHSLELLLGDEPIVVEADRDRVAQVIGNLLSNAIKYSPEGGSVRVTAAAGTSSVRVSIEDAGLGIPREQQGGLFTKFFRVDSSDTRRIGGTGLGLALAKEIVDAHGGTIGFESVEGRGSTFWFELPLGMTGNGAAS